MNKTKLAYWIFTILFSAAMIFSSYAGIRPEPQAVQMLHDLMGYPIYFIQFISVAKIIGSIAILIPGLKTIKEWAYAGLFFDLIGATYSIYSISEKFDPGSLGMLMFIALGALSYYFWKKTTTA
jgi:DoxX-like family